jgi:two-component system response regulator AtoC
MQGLAEETRVLVADPACENRASLVSSLTLSGISCVEAADGMSAWSRFTSEKPDLILAAFRLPGLPAIDLLTRVRDVSNTPFVIQVPAGEFAAAIAAIRNGAADVIPHPCDLGELSKRIRAAIASNPGSGTRTGDLNELTGRSLPAVRIREQIKALSGLRIAVLFRGEKGSGRDHAANALARLDGVDGSDLVKVSPAISGRRTRNDVGKTVYLDEIELHSRADQAYWHDRIRETEASSTNAPRRILVSTTGDLQALARRDQVDVDLADTLLRFVVRIPPLRERPEDLVPLCDVLARRISRRIGRSSVRFTTSAMDLLQKQAWPGNASQLAGVIEKLVAFSTDGLISHRTVSSLLTEAPASVVSLRQDVLRRQRDELIAILDSTGGNLAEAARRMNMSRGAVIYRAQKFGLLAKRVHARA